MENNKCFNYGSPIYHNLKKSSDPEDILSLGLKHKKIYKVKIRKKIKYLIEIYYYENIAFVKFYPKLHENNPDKYKMVGMNLTFPEKRMLLNTCCDIVSKEIEKSPEIIYSFIAQVYDRDNEKEREMSIRFSVYRKVVTTLFKTSLYDHFNIEEINFYCISKKENKKFNHNLGEFLSAAMASKENIVFEFMTNRTRCQFISPD